MSSPMYLMYDGARVSTESQLGKELLKWERKPDWTPEKHPYPMMVYKAMLRPDGRHSVGEVFDSVCGGAPGSAEQWSRRCQLTVNDETEHQKALEGGWRNSPQVALDYLGARENEKSNITAERHYTDARMSEVAQREAAAVDQTTLKQIPSIPEAPRVKRKYTRKAKPVAAE